MAFAVTEERVVVSADTGFGVLPDVPDDRIAGAVVAIVTDRLRVRRLPIR